MRTVGVVLSGIMVVAVAGSGQATDPPKVIAAGDWSRPATDNRARAVRGRLVLCEKVVNADRREVAVYVELQEAEFASESRGYTATKHQREVGTGYFDRVSTVLNPQSATLALVGSTESAQF